MTQTAIPSPRRSMSLRRDALAHGWILGIIQAETTADSPPPTRHPAPARWRRPRFTAACSCPDFCERDHVNE